MFPLSRRLILIYFVINNDTSMRRRRYKRERERTLNELTLTAIKERIEYVEGWRVEGGGIRGGKEKVLVGKIVPASGGYLKVFIHSKKKNFI